MVFKISNFNKGIREAFDVVCRGFESQITIRGSSEVVLKFKYSEKAICKISTVDLSYVVPVKFMVEISQNFLAFSEYLNFIEKLESFF